jgi:parallel beta-helix repeat protein
MTDQPWIVGEGFAGTVSQLFEAGNTIINPDGVFIYNGTPAPGNPPIAYMANPTTTTDQFGNALPTAGGGVVTVDPGFSYAELLDGAISMGLLGGTPSAFPAEVTVAAEGGGQAIEFDSGSLGPGVSSLAILGDSASDSPGLTVISGADGNTYDTMRLTLQTTSLLTVDSTSPVTLFTFPVAAGTYAYQLEIPMLGTGTAIPQLRFSSTAAVVSAMQGETVLDGGTAGGYTAYQTALNTFGPVGPGLVNGDANDLNGSGIFEFSTAGTILVEMNASTSAACCTIPVGARMHLFPVTGLAGTGGGSGPVGETPDWVNIVTDFGALSDPTGVHDSTTAIQNAINNFTTTGRPVYVPTGFYNATSLTWVEGLVIFGDFAGTYPGESAIPGVSIIHRLAGSNEDLFVIPDTIDYGRMQDLAIDGNKTHNTAGKGINVEDGAAGQECQIQFIRVFSHDNPDDNMYLGYQRRGNKVIDGIYNYSAFGDGIQAVGSDNMIRGNICGSNARAGINLGSTATQNWAATDASPHAADVAHVFDNDIYQNLVGVALPESCTNAMVFGNGIDRNLNQGITVYDGTTNTIENNSLHSNGTSANNTYGHIDLYVNVETVGINNNNFGPLDSGITNVASYAVVTESGISPGAILGNIGTIDPTSTVNGLLSTAGANTSPSVVLSAGGAIIQGNNAAQHPLEVRSAAGTVLFNIDNAGTFTVNDGEAKLLTAYLTEQSSAPATPSGGGVLYADATGHLHYLGPGGTDTILAGP